MTPRPMTGVALRLRAPQLRRRELDQAPAALWRAKHRARVGPHRGFRSAGFVRAADRDAQSKRRGIWAGPVGPTLIEEVFDLENGWPHREARDLDCLRRGNQPAQRDHADHREIHGSTRARRRAN